MRRPADPAQVIGRWGTALVDGTICPTWDWSSVPDLYSGKAKYAGMNVQIAASLTGDVAAIGPVPVHGARHDAYAFELLEASYQALGREPLACVLRTHWAQRNLPSLDIFEEEADTNGNAD